MFEEGERSKEPLEPAAYDERLSAPAQFRVLLSDTLRQTKGDVEKAIPLLGDQVCGSMYRTIAPGMPMLKETMRFCLETFAVKMRGEPEIKRPAEVRSAPSSGQRSESVSGKAAKPTKKPLAKRTADAIGAIQGTIGKGLLFSRITSDGRFWGNVGWHELPGLVRDGKIGEAIYAHATPASPTAKVAEVITDEVFAKILEQVERGDG